MSEVDAWVRGWCEGDDDAAMRVCAWLWETLYPVICTALRVFVDASKVESTTSYAFWAALEDLEGQICPGRRWTEWTPETRRVPVRIRKRDGSVEVRIEVRRVFQGKVTGRKLTASGRLRVQSLKALLALFRRMWMQRCRDVLRREYRPNHIPLIPTRDNPDDAQDAVYEDELAGETRDGPSVSFSKDAVRQFAQGLAQAAQQWRGQQKDAVAETADGLRDYIFQRVALTNPQYSTCSPQDLQHLTIEELLAGSDMSYLDLDFDETWDFIEQRYTLTRDGLYQRKRQFCLQLRSLTPIPEIVRQAVKLLRRTDMQHWVEDCRSAATRIPDGDERRALLMVESCLRWTFAQVHPHYCNASLEQVERMEVDALFTINNPTSLIPTYPTRSVFQDFVSTHYPNACDVVAKLPQLRQTLQGLSPRPMRLMTLINALL